MKTTIHSPRLKIAHILSEAVDRIAQPLAAGERGFDYAIRDYVAHSDNEISAALAEYVRALGLGDENERQTTEEEGERNAEIRRTVLLNLARHFDTPEVTGFVKAVLESLYYQRSIVRTMLVQAELLQHKLVVLERGEDEKDDWIAILGPLALLHADPTVMEILVDAPNCVRVVRSGTATAMVEVEVKFASQDELRKSMDGLMRLSGIILRDGNTTGEAHLPDGSRVIAAIPPTSVGSAYLFIEKVDPNKFSFSWEKLLESGTLSPEVHELLMTAIRYQGPCTNILVVGDTRNAKNYLLNLLAESLPAEERIIVVADSFQLPVERHRRRIHLEPGNSSQTTAQRLLEVAARMHADWLVTSDLHGPDALTLIQLLNSGHHGLTTLCAQSPLEALTQIETMCLGANPSLGLSEIRPMIASAIPLVIFMKSYALPDHRIKITQLVEIAGVENDRYMLQPLFTYDNEQGTLHPTEAGKTWTERTRNRIVTG